MTEVPLSPGDILLAGMVGMMRTTSAIKKGMEREPGRKDLFERHIVGAIAEFAAARALNLNWHPIYGASDTDRGDLGPYHIKSITNPRHSLIVRRQDPAEFTYILVLVTFHHATLIGSIPGAEARQEQFWRDENPKAGIHQAAFFVPQSALSDWT
jgi:hypothetical protein